MNDYLKKAKKASESGYKKTGAAGGKMGKKPGTFPMKKSKKR